MKLKTLNYIHNMLTENEKNIAMQWILFMNGAI